MDWSSQRRGGLEAAFYGAFWLSGAVRNGFIMLSTAFNRRALDIQRRLAKASRLFSFLLFAVPFTEVNHA